MRGRKGLDSTSAFIYFSFALIIIFFGGPAIWVFSLSLRVPAEIFAFPPRIIPSIVAWWNYMDVWRLSDMGLYMYNSFKIIFFTVFGVLLVAVPASYAYSRFQFRGRQSTLFGLLVFQMISPLVIAIPLYRYMDQMGLLDTHIGVIMVYIAVQIPFTTWLLKGFFDSIPRSLDEAAMIDGCSRYSAMVRVVAPISAPGITAATIFNAIMSWSQFIIPFILLTRSHNFPVAVGILHFQDVTTETQLHLLAAASVMAMVPPILIFIGLQGFVVKVLISGAVKG